MIVGLFEAHKYRLLSWILIEAPSAGQTLLWVASVFPYLGLLEPHRAQSFDHHEINGEKQQYKSEPVVLDFGDVAEKNENARKLSKSSIRNSHNWRSINNRPMIVAVHCQLSEMKMLNESPEQTKHSSVHQRVPCIHSYLLGCCVTCVAQKKVHRSLIGGRDTDWTTEFLSLSAPGITMAAQEHGLWWYRFAEAPKLNRKNYHFFAKVAIIIILIHFVLSNHERRFWSRSWKSRQTKNGIEIKTGK